MRDLDMRNRRRKQNAAILTMTVKRVLVATALVALMQPAAQPADQPSKGSRDTRSFAGGHERIDVPPGIYRCQLGKYWNSAPRST